MRRYTIQSILGLEGDSFSDDDGNAAEEITNKITPEQKDVIVGLIKDANTDTETFCKHYDVNSVDDIPAERFAEVKKKMDGKVEAFNKINPDGKS